MTDKKKAENVEYFNYLGSGLMTGTGCTREMESRIVVAKAAFSKKKSLLTSKWGLNLRMKLVKCYI
jgi:hypothetical protein